MEYPHDGTGEDAVAEVGSDPGSQSSFASSQGDDENPYAVGAATELSEFAWSDGEVQFTHKDIRVMGDTVLPEICIKTGATENLEEYVRKLSAVTPAYRLWSQLAVGVMLAVMFLPSWVDELAFLEDQHWLFFIAVTCICVPQFWIGRSVTITWYQEKRYVAKKEKWRRRWLPALLLMSVVAFIGIALTGREWWLLLPIVVAVVAVAGGADGSIKARSHYNGQFVLGGHSAAFADAWADQIAAKTPAAPGSS